jgi:hypothetical protein
MSGWVGMILLKQHGVDTVSRLSAHRRADFRKGRRLGKDDHLVDWKKPTSIRSVDRQTYNALPDSVTVREAPLPGGAARIPDPVGRRRDDPAGPRAGEQGGTGFALSGDAGNAESPVALGAADQSALDQRCYGWVAFGVAFERMNKNTF